MYLGFDNLGSESFHPTNSSVHHNNNQFPFHPSMSEPGPPDMTAKAPVVTGDLGMYDMNGISLQAMKAKEQFQMRTPNKYIPIVRDETLSSYQRSGMLSPGAKIPETVSLSDVSKAEHYGEATPLRSENVAPSMMGMSPSQMPLDPSLGLKSFQRAPSKAFSFDNGKNTPYQLIPDDSSHLEPYSVHSPSYHESASVQSSFSNPTTPQKQKALTPNSSDYGSPKQDLGSISETKRSSRMRHSITSLEGDGTGKRKRFLERNRIAASKCRQKKKLWTKDLENSARIACEQSKALRSLVAQLREEVLCLKNQLLAHQDCGCEGIRQYLSSEAMGIMSALQKH
ncbi:DNA-binding transcription factor, Atf-CREB family Atf21 [Schizosaccharomyces osmophilus]|uniref:DNA-binding transcription factor, Atf-CREB family Atf21 n=1 Tax=Schizosaccharomyces osmophilus TaxID=2545709 RepID=A0AAE9WEZ0_9SCHI|nr:DNA-binding transcription factor, Atf-CREB family Atf21 [Schizosaccharomyces osmophilus]WBW74533.1 DNA-binding transcription factor, Atf-CREB family Atf21 [Schizosaccharomyces osmophilus]